MLAIDFCDCCCLEKYGAPAVHLFEVICEGYIRFGGIDVRDGDGTAKNVIRFLEHKGFIRTTETSLHEIRLHPTCLNRTEDGQYFVCLGKKGH